MEKIFPVYLTTAQAAIYCGYSVRYFEQLRKEGRGSRYVQRSRKDVRYKREWLDQWMEEGVK